MEVVDTIGEVVGVGVVRVDGEVGVRSSSWVGEG